MFVILLWYVIGPPELGRRRVGESQGEVKVLREFLEAADMVAGSISKVLQGILGGRGL